MSLKNVQRALEIAWATSPVVAYQTYYQNLSKPATDTEAWVRTWFMANTPAPVYIGSGEQTKADRVTGVFQIDIFYPVTTGPAQEMTDFELVRARYRPYTYLAAYNGTNVLVREVSKKTSIDDNWYRCMIEVTFEAQINR